MKQKKIYGDVAVFNVQNGRCTGDETRIKKYWSGISDEEFLDKCAVSQAVGDANQAVSLVDPGEFSKHARILVACPDFYPCVVTVDTCFHVDAYGVSYEAHSTFRQLSGFFLSKLEADRVKKPKTASDVLWATIVNEGWISSIGYVHRYEYSRQPAVLVSTVDWPYIENSIHPDEIDGELRAWLIENHLSDLRHAMGDVMTKPAWLEKALAGKK